MKNKFTLRLFSVNAMYWAAMAFYTPFIAAYYAAQGLPKSQIGILTAIGPILSICIQPIWAMISDRTGKRKLVLVSITIASAASILLYLIGSSFAVYMAATIIFMSFQTALMPLADAIVTNIGDKEGVKFSTVRMGGTIAFAIVVLIVGKIIPADKMYLRFIYGSIAILVFAATIIALPPDSKYAAQDSDNMTDDESGGKIFKTKMIYFVLVLIFIAQFGLGYNGNFFSVYIVNLGYSQFIVGLVHCTAALSEIPVLMLADKWIKKLGYMNTFLMSAFCVVIRLLLSGSGNLAVMLLSTMLQGLTYILLYYTAVKFIKEYSFHNKISQGQSVLTVVQVGIASVLGNVLGGIMSDAFGIKNTYYIIAAVTFAATVIFAAVYKAYAKGHPEEAKATERQLVLK